VNRVSEILGNTEVGELLTTIKEPDVDYFYSLYLHDFVHYVHKSNHKSSQADLEYVVSLTMLSLAASVIYVHE